MAKISHIIGDRNFEIARDAIGAFLYLELKNQEILQPGFVAPDVWVNRIISFDKSELPAINISIAQIAFSNKHQSSVDGATTFNIDGYVRDDNEAVSMTKCQHLAGKTQAVLEDSQYKTLGFSPPLNCRSLVENISISEPVQIQDLANVCMSRIAFNVVLNETTLKISPPQLQEHLTGVRLTLTDYGYKYEFID